MLYLVVMSPSLIQTVKISQRLLDFHDLDSVKSGTLQNVGEGFLTSLSEAKSDSAGQQAFC